MKKLFERNQLLFALVWIGIYVLAFSVADSVSESFGVRSCITVPLGLLMSVLLFVLISRNQLSDYFGLCKIENNDFKESLFFLPLIIIASANLWYGVMMRYSALETVLTFVSMLFVGFIEEVLFRGFLFKAIFQKRAGLAVAISSITFGMGHIVNLLNGADIQQTLLQICYAIAIGYLFTIIFIKSKSLIPCIITHGILNATGVFSEKSTLGQDVAASAILIIISVGYAVYLKKDMKQGSIEQD